VSGVRRLVALAAALAPSRAAALVGRLAGDVASLRGEALALASTPRRARLAALAAALATGPRPATPMGATGPVGHPLLARLRQEARWRATRRAEERPERFAGEQAEGRTSPCAEPRAARSGETVWRTPVRLPAGARAAGPRDRSGSGMARRVD